MIHCLLNNRLLVLVLTVLLHFNLSSAANNIVVDKDGDALWSYLGSESPNMPVLFHTKGGAAKPAAFGLEYKEGKNALQERLVKNFWKQYANEPDPMHIKLFYCVLFDEKLNIEEIRFQRIGLVERFITELEKSGYFDTLEKEIALTKGKWVRKNKETRHIPSYVYFGWVDL